MTLRHVLIVGGGISGLTAAHVLSKLGPGRYRISLIEASARLGGVIETICQDQNVMEMGPDCFLDKKPEAMAFFESLGLKDRLLSTQSAYRRSYIAKKEKLLPVPEGFYLTAPGNFSALLKMPGLSLGGKIRAACDWILPRRKDSSDESLGGFITRRLGHEVLERIGQPMIGGIYAGDPLKISLQATLPQLHEMETRYGSLIRALAARESKSYQPSSGPRYNLFLSCRLGMQELVSKLLEDLNGVEILTSQKAIGFEQAPERRLFISGGKSLAADAIILALPAHQSADLCEDALPRLSELLRKINYESVMTINFVFRASDVPHSLHGFGFVVPACEKTSISACTFSHRKFAGRVSEGNVLLRVFMGGAFYPGLLDLPEQELQALALADLEKFLGISAPPIHMIMRKYLRSLPQYEVGHLDLASQIEEECARQEGVFLAGNAYRGMGIPDCVDYAIKTARKAHQFLESKVPSV